MLDLKELLSERMQKIYSELIQTNGEYAVKLQKSTDLLDVIEKFVMAEGDQIITEHDKQSFREFMDLELEMQGIEEEQYYICGYSDCVSLLRAIGVFSC